MKKSLLVLILVGVISACNSSKKEEKTASTEVIQEQAATGSDAIAHYMSLKNALVLTEAHEASAAAAKLVESLSREQWNPEIIQATKKITSTNDVEVQRKAFKTVTEGFITSLKANESDNGVFVQYCPMAFDNTGASWLSMSEEIKNPYYGDKMLKCGRVEERI